MWLKNLRDVTRLESSRFLDGACQDKIDTIQIESRLSMCDMTHSYVRQDSIRRRDFERRDSICRSDFDRRDSICRRDFERRDSICRRDFERRDSNF